MDEPRTAATINDLVDVIAPVLRSEENMPPWEADVLAEKIAHRLRAAEAAHAEVAEPGDGPDRAFLRNERVVFQQIVRACEHRSAESAVAHILRTARASVEDIDEMLAKPRAATAGRERLDALRCDGCGLPIAPTGWYHTGLPPADMLDHFAQPSAALDTPDPGAS